MLRLTRFAIGFALHLRENVFIVIPASTLTFGVFRVIVRP
jgi:hypothetical protein